MRGEIDAIYLLKNQQLFWFDILREMSLAVIPDKVWLTKTTFVKTAGNKGQVGFGLQATGLAFSHAQVTAYTRSLFSMANGRTFHRPFHRTWTTASTDVQAS